jgi:hypothetical protein
MDRAKSGPQVICVAGLPGSGKTFYAENLQKRIPNSILFDDVKIEDIEKIKEASDNFSTIILTDPWFCDAACRRRAEKKLKETLGENIIIEWVFFKNDLAQCRENVKIRNDGREVNGSLRRFSKIYEVPDGVQVLPVWKLEHNL